jgi:hypothetical protein
MEGGRGVGSPPATQKSKNPARAGSLLKSLRLLLRQGHQRNTVLGVGRHQERHVFATGVHRQQSSAMLYGMLVVLLEFRCGIAPVATQVPLDREVHLGQIEIHGSIRGQMVARRARTRNRGHREYCDC